MKPFKITMKEGYTEEEYSKDVKAFEKEGSFLSSYKDNKQRMVFIIDEDKSEVLKSIK